ncbi:MAG: type II toxin-antitoxin system VapC family toxin [Candidatus Woesearchaeota archaeon]
MEKLVHKVCFDTDILIDVLRNRRDAVSFVKEIEQKHELTTTPITVFELFRGAFKSRNPDKAALGVATLLQSLTVLNLSMTSCRKAGFIAAELEKNGMLLDFHDVLIAAVALENDCSIKTNNKKHFSRIPGLKVL